MARKAKVASNPAQVLDQAKIDAALAGAVTMADGSTPPPPSHMETTQPTNEGNDSCCKMAEDRNESIANDDFLNDCYACDIDAKQCHDESDKFFDESIKEYIRLINKKIYDETRKGGYSTNINFRVTPQDWVNVSHITDWYRTRGFLVVMTESTTPPYGKDVGTMEHHFTISWANVQE